MVATNRKARDRLCERSEPLQHMDTVLTGLLRKRCAFSNTGLTATALFVNFRAALQSAKHQECCGIGAIIPPILPPGISDFVC